MIKCKTVSIVTLLLFTQQISPVAGGMFLYRYNNNKNDVEFLFTLDPSHSEKMKGFDYPGGTIGPEKKNQFEGNEIDGFLSPNGSFDYDNPYTFLRGAIREMLEELVFIPIDLFQKKGQFAPPPSNPTAYLTSKKIDKQYEIKAIDFIENKIKTNGIFFIYKKQTTGNKPWEKAAVFFLDITDICPSNLPEEIVKKRINLQTQGFRLRNIDAEPVAFAWVKGNDILKFIGQNNPNEIDYTQYAEHDEKTNKLQNSNNTNYPDLVNLDTKKIKISNICIEMMKNRMYDKDNPQPDIVVIRRRHDIIYFDDLKHISSQNPPTQSSSMGGVINFLQNHPTILKPTSAPPPTPPTPKSTFNVQDWIKRNFTQLKNAIDQLLSQSDTVAFYDVRNHNSLQHPLPSDLDDTTITKINNDLFKLINRIRYEKKLSQQLLTQALELAALLKK